MGKPAGKVRPHSTCPALCGRSSETRLPGASSPVPRFKHHQQNQKKGSSPLFPHLLTHKTASAEPKDCSRHPRIPKVPGPRHGCCLLDHLVRAPRDDRLTWQLASQRARQTVTVSTTSSQFFPPLWPRLLSKRILVLGRRATVRAHERRTWMSDVFST